VQDTGCRVTRFLRVRDKGLRFRDKGFGFTMRIMGSRVQRFRFGVSGFRV